MDMSCLRSRQVLVIRRCFRATKCRRGARTCWSRTTRCWSTCFCDRLSEAFSNKRQHGWPPTNPTSLPWCSTRRTCIAVPVVPRMPIPSQGRQFMLIKGEQLKKTGECPATTSEAAALAAYDITTLHNSVLNPVAASEGFGILLDALGQKPPASQDNQAGLQQVVYEWLQSFGPAALITNEVTAQPRQLREVARLAFPSSDKAAEAMEAMLALMSFAKEKDSGRVFAPVRSHMFFRGLAGIFACVDPTCTERGTSGRAILGKTYSMPMLRCACGSRVYEVLTHRDCGAAFIRGYVQNELGKFLWHQPSTGLWGEGGLVEAHFLVEVDRRAHGNGTRGRMEGTQVWLHKATDNW